MSASREKNTRKESVLTKNTQELRSRQDANKDRSFYIKCIAAVVALAVVFVLCFLYSNDSIRKNMTAVTVDGEKFTATDLNYYYYTSLDQYGSYLTYFGADPSQDLDAVEYADGQSWGDYFRDSAVLLLTQTVTMYNQAMADGYEISDELQQEIDDYSASIDSYCESNAMTREQFLTSRYGANMTDEIFMRHLTMSFVASDYMDHYRQTHEYTEEEMEAYYEEHPEEINLASYEVLTVNADYSGIEGVTEGSTDEEPTYTEAQTEQAMDAAKETANAFLDRVDAGESLADIAAEYGENYYSKKTDASYASYTDYTFNDWVFNESRVPGEASVVIDEAKNCWYVVVLDHCERPEYNTVDVRHILIQPLDSGLTEGEDGYEEAEALNNAQAETRAQDILDEYLAGEHTAEAFGALADEYSADTDAGEGGLYTQVYKGQMLDAFENWCFDPVRQAGDTGIVETSSGYHVMYFQGEDLPYWQVRCIDGLYTQWQDDIFNGATVKRHLLGIQAAGGVRQ